MPDSAHPPELETLRHVPEGARDGSPLVVLLHGRGADEGDLLGLASFLPGDALLVTPRAPYPAAPWGYGPGWAWYRYQVEDRVVEETLAGSLGALDALMSRLESELPVRPGIRVLGGFSQGGTTAMAWALSRPGRVAGVVNFSGFLVDSPLLADAPLGEDAPPVFWGHGREDHNIPFSLAEKGRAKLVEAGIAVEPFDHPGGHTITAEEVQGFRSWMDTLVEDG